MTIRLAGLVRSSKSPWRTASDKKAVEVSNDALRNGAALDAIPVRLKAL
jgi:hypothetical protein